MKKLVFVCAPHIGLLDMWVPILAALRERLPEGIFVLLAPHENALHALKPVKDLADPIFDEVFVRSRSGGWSRFESLYAVTPPERTLSPGHATDSWFIQATTRLARALGLATLRRRGSRAIENLRFGSRCSSTRLAELAGINGENGVLLFDLSQSHQPYMREIVKISQDWAKFSLSHGGNVLGIDPRTIPAETHTFTSQRLIALLSSNQELEFYQSHYKLCPEQLVVLGVPRQRKDWVAIVRRSSKKFTPPKTRWMLVISRQLSVELPRSRKVEAIRDIQEAALRHNLVIVVKGHPEESLDGTYEEVLGEPQLGNHWFRSDHHPLVLAETCSFAVTFGSSLALDLVSCGVPVIERLNLTELAAFQGRNVLRDRAGGEPVSSFRYLGLVLGATNSVDFQRIVTQVLNDPETAVATLQRKQRSVFPNPDRMFDRVVDLICQAS